jgi:hypothetical protein
MDPEVAEDAHIVDRIGLGDSDEMHLVDGAT